MIYLYECKHEECEEFNNAKEIHKPMIESGRPEICESCNQEMRRVYTSFAMRNGDGYKS